MTQPNWTKQLISTDFYADLPTDRESGYGTITKKWLHDSKLWLKKYLVTTFNVNPKEVIFNQGYFEWSCFALVGSQWWYFSTGDIRFKILGSLLVRTARHNKDYTGGGNRFVDYNSRSFEENLTTILQPSYNRAQFTRTEMQP